MTASVRVVAAAAGAAATAIVLRRRPHLFLRPSFAVVGCFKIAAQLVELWWRLRTEKVKERETARRQAIEFAALLKALPKLTEPWAARLRRRSDKWQGRGIVVVAGGEKYGMLAVSLVDSLRSCGCTLPIEIFYLGSHELKCSTMVSLAARERCTLRDLLAGQPTLRDVQGFGYAAKPLALAASSFAEVLLLDADIIALRDPSFLFDEASYLTHGAVFWSDMYAANETFVRLYDPRDVRLRPSMLERAVQDALDAWLIKPVRMKPDFVPALSTIGLPPDAPTHESGQVLMDKRRCVDALAAAGLLNSNTHRPLVYSGLHGDKDTFRTAFAATSTAFHHVPHRPALGGHVDSITGVFQDTCFIQPDLSPSAAPLFLHFCGRHRNDDERRVRLPTAFMSARGRPFRLWPHDGRRGYMGGTVRPFQF